MSRPSSCPMCGAQPLEVVFTYDKPPAIEVALPIPPEAYHREMHRCPKCGHYVSVHELDLDALYGGEYVNATYGATGLAGAFGRIMSLPEYKSDNVHRVHRVRDYARETLGPDADTRPLRVLDAGSGLCVFLARLKQETAWLGTALDMDPRQVAHARDVVGVEAVCGPLDAVPQEARFDVIAFNKVLEHLRDPVAPLQQARGRLAEGGFVYIELPDAVNAAKEGPEREEFLIEHWHVFSPDSLRLLAEKAGFHVDRLDILHEPSTKYTLAAFLKPA